VISYSYSYSALITFSLAFDPIRSRYWYNSAYFKNLNDVCCFSLWAALVFLPYVPLKFNVCIFFYIAPALTPVWLVKWVFSACGADSAKKYDHCKFSSPSSPSSLLLHQGGGVGGNEGIGGGGRGGIGRVLFLAYFT
jgi:hypothetical protein